MGEFKPSKNQVRVFTEVKDTNNSILIRSVAGSGKTTTIIKCLEFIPKNQECIFIAFNRHTVADIKEKIPNKPKNISISTMHGFGSQVLYNHLGKLPVVENKTFKRCLSFYKQWEERGEVKEVKWTYCDRVAQLTNMMKLTLTPPTPEEVTKLALQYDIMFIGYEIEHAIEAYENAVKDTAMIDFNDMLFFPAIKNFKMKRFETIFVDEAQDLSAVAHCLLKKMLKPGGRLIAVGDNKQSIYGFAGADFNSFEKVKNIVSGTKLLPLDISYRCSKAVVRHAQEIVPDIKFYEGAKEGWVGSGSMKLIKDGDMVLCRNLKPLVILLLDLIDKGKKAFIKGREIGDNLVKLIQKTKQTNNVSLIKHLKLLKVQLKAKLMKKGVFKTESHNLMREITERIEIIKIFSSKADTPKQIIAMISAIFIDDKDAKGVMLSTIHKAKGLENPNVFMLCPELMPSQYATTKDALLQEDNLRYVAITRSQDRLTYIDDFYLTNEDQEEEE